jgi:YD repeat-containing protein
LLYDAAGNLTGSLDARGNLTQYQLDASNRVTVTIDALANRTTQLFDAAGNLKDASNNLSTFADEVGEPEWRRGNPDPMELEPKNQTAPRFTCRSASAAHRSLLQSRDRSPSHGASGRGLRSTA